MYKTEELTVPITKESFIYKTLLFLYPDQYRKKFGEQMLLVFQDMYEDEYKNFGKIRSVFWLRVSTDALQSIITQHLDFIKKEGLKKYLREVLHVNKYSVIGAILLLPFTTILGLDFVARILQRDLTHYSRPLNNYFSHIFLYQDHIGKIPLLWFVLIFFPILSIVLNIIPLHKSFFKNPVTLAILGLAGLALLIVYGHDFVPCIVQGILYHHAIINLPKAILICRNA